MVTLQLHFIRAVYRIFLYMLLFSIFFFFLIFNFYFLFLFLFLNPRVGNTRENIYISFSIILI